MCGLLPISSLLPCPSLLTGWVMLLAADSTWGSLADGFNAIWSRPIIALSLFTLPLVLAAVFAKAYPHMRLLALCIVPVVVSPAIAFGLSFTLRGNTADAAIWIVVIDAIILLVALFDLITLPRKGDFTAERECLRIASLDRNHPVTLTINNNGRHAREIVVRDDFPQEFDVSKAEFDLAMQPRSRATLKYDLIASRRGAFELEKVYLKLKSHFGLWQKFVDLPVTSSINVYPDMKQLSRYALLARTNRLSLVGVRRTRRIGQDHEFERLRDYTPDDNYRHMDWRATARRHKLTVRDFQSSQSQRVIFLIDCGRMMTNHASGLSLLDHSLNAMLMLSYVALQRGDAVGMIAFSDSIHSFVPPRGGMNQMNQLLHASFDRFPNIVESRYDQAFRYLSSHCQKRSLVVLITNVVDEVNANQLHQYLSSIAGRHLPLGVMLRDHRIFDAADMAAPSGESLYRSAAAAEILTWRHQVITALEHRGVLSLDTFPEDMTAPLVNRYLEVKARHLL